MFEEVLNEAGRILKVIAIYPTKGLTLREISRKSGVSLGKTSEIIELFRKKEIIRIKQVGKSYLITFNFDNEEAIRLKRSLNISLFLNSEIVDKIIEAYPDVAVLFGSFEKGFDTEGSDIDILVVGKTVPELESFMNRKMDIHFFKSFSEIPEELLESASNGMVICGFLEGRR